MTKKKEANESVSLPRGFGSAESKKKVEIAGKLIVKKYSAMSAKDISDYLMEVGAGRVLALISFAEKEEVPAKPAAKKAKPAAKKGK